MPEKPGEMEQIVNTQYYGPYSTTALALNAMWRIVFEVTDCDARTDCLEIIRKAFKVPDNVWERAYSETLLEYNGPVNPATRKYKKRKGSGK